MRSTISTLSRTRFMMSSENTLFLQLRHRHARPALGGLTGPNRRDLGVILQIIHDRRLERSRAQTVNDRHHRQPDGSRAVDEPLKLGESLTHPEPDDVQPVGRRLLFSELGAPARPPVCSLPTAQRLDRHDLAMRQFEFLSVHVELEQTPRRSEHRSRPVPPRYPYPVAGTQFGGRCGVLLLLEGLGLEFCGERFDFCGLLPELRLSGYGRPGKLAEPLPKRRHDLS